MINENNDDFIPTFMKNLKLVIMKNTTHLLWLSFSGQKLLFTCMLRFFYYFYCYFSYCSYELIFILLFLLFLFLVLNSYLK